MKFLRLLVFFATACCLIFSVIHVADAEHWPPTKQEIQVRLIALAIVYPRSSFFANDEVFVAEEELTQEESRFIKLVYDFLPYQSPLSESGLNYSLVYTVSAMRDVTCDESLSQMRLSMQNRLPAKQSSWKYAAESPVLDLDRRQAKLRCYRTTSDDYQKAMHKPSASSLNPHISQERYKNRGRLSVRASASLRSGHE